MAESQYLARLERLEGAFVHITDLLVLQGERLDSVREELLANRGEMQGLRREMDGLRGEMRGEVDGLRGEMQGLRGEMRGEMQGLRDEMRAVRDETRAMGNTLADRLDRLIAITTKDRTLSIERLATIEMRLARLEERVGI